MFGQDDLVSPRHPQFFSPLISAIPTTRPDWGWGHVPPRPPWLHYCRMPCTHVAVTAIAYVYASVQCSGHLLVSVCDDRLCHRSLS